MSIAQQVKYRLYGLPEAWVDSTYEDTGLNPPEVKRLEGAFSTIRKGVCYVQGNAGPVATGYLKQGKKVRGIDATPFLLDPFDKEEKKGLPQAEVVFIYNCIETTTNALLTSKVIKKLVQNYPNEMVVLVGDIPGRAFAKDMFQVKNFVSIPNKEETKWL